MTTSYERSLRLSNVAAVRFADDTRTTVRLLPGWEQTRPGKLDRLLDTTTTGTAADIALFAADLAGLAYSGWRCARYRVARRKDWWVVREEANGVAEVRRDNFESAVGYAVDILSRAIEAGAF